MVGFWPPVEVNGALAATVDTAPLDVMIQTPLEGIYLYVLLLLVLTSGELVGEKVFRGVCNAACAGVGKTMFMSTVSGLCAF
jgi:hypothetical protein